MTTQVQDGPRAGVVKSFKPASVDHVERRKLLLQARLGHMPFHRQVAVLPGLGLVFSAAGYNIPDESINGYVGVLLGQCLHRIPFHYVGNWSMDDIDLLRHSQFARAIMRKLYPLLMEAKGQGKVNFFKIKGMTFNYEVGVSDNYFTY